MRPHRSGRCPDLPTGARLGDNWKCPKCSRRWIFNRHFSYEPGRWSRFVPSRAYVIPLGPAAASSGVQQEGAER